LVGVGDQRGHVPIVLGDDQQVASFDRFSDRTHELREKMACARIAHRVRGIDP
jgi:hypothetical protein